MIWLLKYFEAYRAQTFRSCIVYHWLELILWQLITIIYQSSLGFLSFFMAKYLAHIQGAIFWVLQRQRHSNNCLNLNMNIAIVVNLIWNWCSKYQPFSKNKNILHAEHNFSNHLHLSNSSIQQLCPRIECQNLNFIVNRTVTKWKYYQTLHCKT